MSSGNYYRSWMDKTHLDPNTNLLTEEYTEGIGEFMRLVQQQPEANTAVEKKVGVTNQATPPPLTNQATPQDKQPTPLAKETGGRNKQATPHANETVVEANAGNPVDHLEVMKEAYTNKKTGEIQNLVIKDVIDFVQTQKEALLASQPISDDDSSAASTNMTRDRINEMVEEGAYSCPSSSQASFVPPDPMIIQQLQNKDDRIVALET
ncbi:hypothetical protein F2Q69_00014181 [Brassica cretica]|uniref:Uncharacterized protein n=1 Tax=Brassica cretica TaxID=69181 RepID=A0A8S9QUE4_BRACR|nr:hypothetical protein F2Q69_00014181 [Brassica cretica]